MVCFHEKKSLSKVHLNICSRRKEDDIWFISFAWEQSDQGSYHLLLV